jgi:hypothetical protein
MPTTQQIQIIQIARRQVGLDESDYRLLLWNVAGVESCKELDNVGVEDFLAVLEDMGFRTIDKPGDYWREKVQSRASGRIGERMVYRIRVEARGGKYPLESICLRLTKGRTSNVEELNVYEAVKVFEAFVAIGDRQHLEQEAEATRSKAAGASQSAIGNQKSTI